MISTNQYVLDHNVKDILKLYYFELYNSEFSYKLHCSLLSL